LDEAKSETKDSTVLGLIDKERSYIASLKEAAIKGSIENSKILSE
jgi:hypothetical protein